MTIDPRTPVVVGVGQLTQRAADPMTSLEPIDLLAEAARTALADAGGTGLTLDTVAVAEIMSWRYPDPAATLARRLGVTPGTTVVSSTGGNSPQMMLNRCAEAIQSGGIDAVLIGGVECMYSRRRVRKIDRSLRLPWTTADDRACPNVWGDTRPGASQYEMAHRALAPTQVYPLFETALRHAAGRSIAAHQEHLGALWSSLAAVAATNPHAWSPTAYSPAEIVTPTPENRMANFPYTKRLCANLDVDQAAAVVLCSHAAATAAGIAPERMVFPWSGADAHDHYFFSERDSLHRSPAIGIIGDAALDAAGVDLDAVARFDLYSCFPSAVEVALDALGLAGPTGGDERPITVTGGLAYGGGPGNNYVTHSIAAMVEACRRDPESIGLVTGLGWYTTKHSVGLYSTAPPSAGYRRVDPVVTQARVDALPSREPAGVLDTDGEVEATSVAFDHDATPTIGILSVLLADGRRALANCTDVDTLRAMVAEPWEGRRVTLVADGDTNRLA